MKVPKRMNFRKSSKGGEGVIFNPKIYIADFGNFNQGFIRFGSATLPYHYCLQIKLTLVNTTEKSVHFALSVVVMRIRCRRDRRPGNCKSPILSLRGLQVGSFEKFATHLFYCCDANFAKDFLGVCTSLIVMQG